MKGIVLTLSFLLFLTVFFLQSTYAKGKDEAPDQTKKEENSSQGNQNKTAEVGKVEEVSGNTIVIEEKNTRKRSESVVDKNTKIVGQDKKALRVSSIKPNDKVAVISDSTESAKPKKAIKVYVKKDASGSAQLKKKAVQGIITEINGSLLTVAHQIHRERITQVLVTGSTFIKTKDQVSSPSASMESSASAAPSTLQVGYRIVAVGDVDASGVLVARKIHVIPGRAVGIYRRFPIASASASPSVTATPTATLTASPSAAPTSSPSGTLSL